MTYYGHVPAAVTRLTEAYAASIGALPNDPSTTRGIQYGRQTAERFIATAAQMMRRILIDHARGRGTVKRGGGAPALPLIEAALIESDSLDELVAIHDAIDALSVIDRIQAKLVELRFFGGMTHDEIAVYLGISLATVERRWRLARAWLYRRLKDAVA